MFLSYIDIKFNSFKENIKPPKLTESKQKILSLVKNKFDVNNKKVKIVVLTNEKNNSLYYDGKNEQIVTNNTSSIIYFNKKRIN